MKHNSASSQTNGPALLDDVAALIGQYLSCSPDQLNILALWVLHTYCFTFSPVTPYLNIHSRQKQSGKTLCLELLTLLSSRPWLHTAVPPSILRTQLQEEDFIGTLLLDDCHVTLGSSRRNVRAQGLLSAGFKAHGSHSFCYRDDQGVQVSAMTVFAPKAFAGDGVLPSCLAGLSIPIALEPKQTGSACQRFRFDQARELARPLAHRLEQWVISQEPRLGNMAPYTEDQFPPELSSRQQDCAEPLLHIADLIGGEWPLRARRALVNVYTAAAFEDPIASFQLLFDLRDAFLRSADQDWISTADLLRYLHDLDDRQWHEWHEGGPLGPSDLARLLAPFGIGSRNHRTGPTTVVKGYYRQDFVKSWDRHLPACSGVAVVFTDQKVGDPVCSGVAADFADPKVTDLACSGVAADFADSRVTDSACSGVAAKIARSPVRDS